VHKKLIYLGSLQIYRYQNITTSSVIKQCSIIMHSSCNNQFKDTGLSITFIFQCLMVLSLKFSRSNIPGFVFMPTQDKITYPSLLSNFPVSIYFIHITTDHILYRLQDNTKLYSNNLINKLTHCALLSEHLIFPLHDSKL